MFTWCAVLCAFLAIRGWSDASVLIPLERVAPGVQAPHRGNGGLHGELHVPVSVSGSVSGLVSGSVSRIATAATSASSSAAASMTASGTTSRVREFPGVPEQCMRCLCHAATHCDASRRCVDDVCGPYGITWAYWSDGGKLSRATKAHNDLGPYIDCTTDLQCAANTINNYMAKFHKDCNGDGVIDCRDFAAIHKLGPFRCHNPLPSAYAHDLQQCLTQA